MALPNEIRTIPMIMGNDAVECTKIKLLPANATGNTAFTATSNNRIIFNIPAYPKSFISPKRSYISFKGKASAKDANGNDLAENTRFVDGLPIIERMVLRAGNGVILEDIQDYYLIERILNNAMDKETLEARGDVIGDRRAYIADTGTGGVAEIYTEDKAGRIFTKDLLSGVLGKHQDMYVPVGMFETSGGYAFQLELYLASNEIACRNDTAATNKVSYELTEVRMNLEVVQFEDEIMRMFNTSVLKGGAIEMPFKSFRLHRSTLAAGNTAFDVNITESAHNIDQVYTTILPAINTTTQVGGAYTSITNLTEDHLSGRGGVDYAEKVKMYQFRYGTKYYPTDKVENNGTTDTTATYLASLSSIDALSKPTWLGGRLTNGKRNWERNFFIAQGFKTFSGKNVLNGLNTSASGAPLQLFLEFTSGLPLSTIVYTFVQAQHRLHIKAGGMASLIDG